MSKGTCKNCGADEGLHHYETMQCPYGGYEAPIGRTQRWSVTRYEEDKQDELAELKQQVKTLQSQVKALLDAVSSAKVETE